MRCFDCRRTESPTTSGTFGIERIVPPLQGSGIGLGPVDPGRSAWALLDRPFGAHLPTLSPGERENRLRAQARKNCVFLLRGEKRVENAHGT